MSKGVSIFYIVFKKFYDNLIRVLIEEAADMIIPGLVIIVKN